MSLVYVLAAYSITLCVLLVYGLLLQHRARVALARLQGTGAGVARGFNFGAALLAPFWALAHGVPTGGLTLLVSLGALGVALSAGLRVAVLVLTALLVGASIFLGIVGDRIAAAHQAPLDPERFSSRQLAWGLAGALVHTVLLPWIVYFRLTAV